MFFLHRVRVKKRLLLALTSILLLLLFLTYHARPSKILPIKINEHTCSVYFKELEKNSKNWSNDFFVERWWSHIPLLEKVGDDVIKHVDRLQKFHKCLNDGGLRKEDITDVQSRLFPYLDFEKLHYNEADFWPVHTRWNGEIYQQAMLKFDHQTKAFIGIEQIHHRKGQYFWDQFAQNMTQRSSRGIVISVGNYQVGEVIRLIRVLRLLRNDLPIQIVHKGDLSEQYQEFIAKAATENHTDNFPNQELWFLNIENVLKPGYFEKFKNFGNKWLAIIFCSFDSPILLDSDTIPFTSLQRYYDYEQYERMGSVFFKDRKITNDLMRSNDLDTLNKITKSLLNLDFSKSNLDETLKKLAQTNDRTALETLDNLFSNRYKHHMESGLVVLDKKRNLSSLLTAVILHFSSINTIFHGDKEWFWFGQFLDRQLFTFHPQDASNTGKLGNVVVEGFEGDFYQICSVQLSHTDIDDSLLWLNGGLNVCKKNSWQFDFTKNKRVADSFDSVDQVKDYYLSPIELEGTIIPDVDVRPWIRIGECAGYNYCTLYKEGEFGKFRRFTDEEKREYNEIINIWNMPV